jgi:hypothetical protein
VPCEDYLDERSSDHLHQPQRCHPKAAISVPVQHIVRSPQVPSSPRDHRRVPRFLSAYWSRSSWSLSAPRYATAATSSAATLLPLADMSVTLGRGQTPLGLAPIARPCIRHEIHLQTQLLVSTGLENTRYCFHGGSAKAPSQAPSSSRSSESLSQIGRAPTLTRAGTDRSRLGRSAETRHIERDAGVPPTRSPLPQGRSVISAVAIVSLSPAHHPA